MKKKLIPAGLATELPHEQGWKAYRAAERQQQGPKVTVCPSTPYDPRYQLPPGERVFGAGFAAVGVGRDVRTGRGWGGKA